jgi:integrase
VLNFKQAKTGAKVRVEVTGELSAVLARIRARKMKYAIHCTRLVVNPYGKPISVHALSRHWTAACLAAGVVGYQFRDLRAKAATDTEAASGSLRDAQRQLGHASLRMTEHYSRNRRGAMVSPTGTRKSPNNAEKESAPKGA